jgi:ATP-dependent Clp protease ATP-binding subunit ClpC
VIELAVDEARRLNHHYIGTEHLLLGLLREGEGIGAGVLESFGLNLQEVRAKTIKVLTDRRNDQHDEKK